jgi:hypothetical protein
MNMRSSPPDTSCQGWVGLKHSAVTAPSCPVSLSSRGGGVGVGCIPCIPFCMAHPRVIIMQPN